ncbi:MAG: hypothetical protein ACLQKA_24910, partial [Bryobacteraceae bacterium]
SSAPSRRLSTAGFRPLPSITRPDQSGQITCESDRTTHILATRTVARLDITTEIQYYSEHFDYFEESR